MSGAVTVSNSLFFKLREFLRFGICCVKYKGNDDNYDDDDDDDDDDLDAETGFDWTDVSLRCDV